jgi:formyltetrahydrofolate deformylase
VINDTGILLLQCPNQSGIIAATAAFIDRYHGNVTHANEHLDADTGMFLMRMQWDMTGFQLTPEGVHQEFAPIAEKYQMQWRFALSRQKQRVAIMVSKFDHCLADLLYRHQTGEIYCDIPFVISNHPDSRELAAFHRVPYHQVRVAKENKDQAEAEVVRLMETNAIDLIVLARYMQILSDSFIRRYPKRIINIHHSFLPAFIGARPHHRSYERGVKLVGATSHYVTEVLDEGPIIEQDVTRVSHRDTLEGLIQKGRDLERVVLSRAVRWHLEHRILVYGNKTVVFD